MHGVPRVVVYPGGVNREVYPGGVYRVVYLRFIRGFEPLIPGYSRVIPVF